MKWQVGDFWREDAMSESKPIELNEHDRGLVRHAIVNTLGDCELAAKINRRAERFVEAAERDLRASHYRRILALFAVLLMGGM